MHLSKPPAQGGPEDSAAFRAEAEQAGARWEPPFRRSLSERVGAFCWGLFLISKGHLAAEDRNPGS